MPRSLSLTSGRQLAVLKLSRVITGQVFTISRFQIDFVFVRMCTCGDQIIQFAQGLRKNTQEKGTGRREEWLSECLKL